MKNKHLFFCLLFLMVGWSLGAETIQGKVIDNSTQKPIEGASVFLEGSSIGTSTATDGTFRFTFKELGFTKLVITHLGYAPYAINVSQIKTGEPLTVTLKEKDVELKEISVEARDVNRPENLRLFTRTLLGYSQAGKNCEIINPEVISFRRQYDKDKKLTLKAFADAPILIENRALGYLIEYTSVDFTLTPTRMSFFGYPFFKEIYKKDNKQTKKVLNARKKAYYGSTMHFFRSLFKDSLASEGFVVNKTKIVNDSVLIGTYLMDTTTFNPNGKPQKRLLEMNIYKVINDLSFTRKEGYHLQQTNTSIDLDSMVQRAGNKAALTLFDPIEICYIKAGEEPEYLMNHPFMGRFLSQKKMQTTLIRLLDDVVEFDSYGLVFDPTGMTNIGYWGYKRMGDLLPINYVPEPD